MRFIIERFLSDETADASTVAIGAVSADSAPQALAEAAAIGLAETGDRYRATAPQDALAVALSAARHRRGQAWERGQTAVCGILARTVRIVADDGGPTVLVHGGSTGRAHVARGSLYPITTRKVAQDA